MSFMFNPHPYDDYTAINRPAVPDGAVQRAVFGAEKAMQAISQALLDCFERRGHCVAALDGYPSAEFVQYAQGIARGLRGRPAVLIDTGSLCLPAEELHQKLLPFLPEDRRKDPVLLYGRLFEGSFCDLMDPEKLAAARARCRAARKNGEIVILYGMGAACRELRGGLDCIAYLDVTPKQVMLRAHAGRWKNFGDRQARPVKELQRRAYYVDFELAGALRGELIREGLMDFYLSTDTDLSACLLQKDDFMAVTQALAGYPFRCKPVYLEGVWGGYYIQHARRLPDEFRNIAWVFDLIPMEVSILVQLGGRLLEMPFFTFVQSQGEAILGPEVHKRFGGYFPIRFNYDDTFHSNGNMSVQVHPPRDFCMETFGEHGSQDEGYYIVATGHGAATYCGLRRGVDKDAFFEHVRRSEQQHTPIDYQQYIHAVPSVPGQQFLIPGGTVHASGRNQLILEIGSLTMGSYTFKLYDYLRRDLDGNPRPIHSLYGEEVLDAGRDETFVHQRLVKAPVLARSGDGFEEYIVGEDDLVYYSTRQLRLEHRAQDDTAGKFHVLALVDGEQATVRSLACPERSYTMNYLDIIVVPACLGAYEVINEGGQPIVVYKVMVR